MGWAESAPAHQLDQRKIDGITAGDGQALQVCGDSGHAAEGASLDQWLHLLLLREHDRRRGQPDPPTPSQTEGGGAKDALVAHHSLCNTILSLALNASPKNGRLL